MGTTMPMGIGIWPKNRDFYPDLLPTSAQIHDFLSGLVDDLLGDIGVLYLLPRPELQTIRDRVLWETQPRFDTRFMTHGVINMFQTQCTKMNENI